MDKNFILNLSCPDQIGIVAAVTSCIAAHNTNIITSSQHGEKSNNSFFMRVELDRSSFEHQQGAFVAEFTNIAEHFQMNWHLRDHAQKRRVIILASKQAHCVADLLYRWRSAELPCEIPAVISNHSDLESYVKWHDIPYHHIDLNGEQKAAGFGEIDQLIEHYRADVIVLARFMQILPPELCKKYAGKIINIHHSFLPAFIGANPYVKAYEKGVKLVGATSHYVTEVLDEGPIIEQSVVRINHGHSPDDIKRLGKDVEKNVLARGVYLHLQDRVLIHGNKTVVF